MKIKFWGVRGSLPASEKIQDRRQRLADHLRDFLQSGKSSVNDVDHFVENLNALNLQGYGSATTCVQVFDPKHSLQNLIIDGGSGLKILNDELIQKGLKQKEFHILMTHFHSDHIMGLPFFAPHFIAGCSVHYYSVQSECEEVIRGLFSKPTFPVGYENLKAQIHFHQLSPYEKRMINGFSVTPYLLDHPDPCYGFRIEQNGVSYGHAVDSEIVRIRSEDLGPDAELYQNLNLLYIDAQYLEEEMNHKKGWGHGTFDRVFKICSHHHVQQALLGHFDPSAGFQDIQNFKARAQHACKNEYAEIKTQWDFAYEGLEVELLHLRLQK